MVEEALEARLVQNLLEELALHSLEVSAQVRHLQRASPDLGLASQLALLPLERSQVERCPQQRLVQLVLEQPVRLAEQELTVRLVEQELAQLPQPQVLGEVLGELVPLAVGESM